MKRDQDGAGMYLLVLAALVFFAWAAAPWLDSLGAEPLPECPTNAKRIMV